MQNVTIKIQSLLESRDDHYAAFGKKTEDIFYNHHVERNPEWSAIWETRESFHLADVCTGMSVRNYIEIAFAQGRNPEWLAHLLYTLAIDADKEIA